MRLKAGEVIPFGILNDNELSVNVVFDNDLFEIIGIHLLRNDKTLFMKTNELIRMIKEHGNSFESKRGLFPDFHTGISGLLCSV